MGQSTAQQSKKDKGKYLRYRQQSRREVNKARRLIRWARGQGWNDSVALRALVALHGNVKLLNFGKLRMEIQELVNAMGSGNKYHTLRKLRGLNRPVG